jgi:hypothetical protein
MLGELAELRKMLSEVTKRLDAIEGRLSRTEAPVAPPGGYLRFPIDMERAMSVPIRARDLDRRAIEIAPPRMRSTKP